MSLSICQNALNATFIYTTRKPYLKKKITQNEVLGILNTIKYKQTQEKFFRNLKVKTDNTCKTEIQQVSDPQCLKPNSVSNCLSRISPNVKQWDSNMILVLKTWKCKPCKGGLLPCWSRNESLSTKQNFCLNTKSPSAFPNIPTLELKQMHTKPDQPQTGNHPAQFLVSLLFNYR